MTLFKLSRIQSSGCLSVSCAVKTFSYAVAGGVRWSSSSTDKNKSIFDIEQEMFQHKRLMSTAYSQGSFRVALEHAQELKRKALEIMGIRTTVYASSLNNVALMYKMLGEQDKALETYKEALVVYEDVTGKEHASYAATLCNLGVLYKEISRGRLISKMDQDGGSNTEKYGVVPVRGLERIKLLESAEEALVQARATRIKLFGTTHKDSLYSSMHVASLWNLQEKYTDSLGLLLNTLKEAEVSHGPRDPVCAAIHNDLGFLYKSKKKFDQAKEHYIKALDIRRVALGEFHQETVVSSHNLAELYEAINKPEEAYRLRETLLTGLENVVSGSGHEINGSAAVTSGAKSTTTAAAGNIKIQVHHQVNSFSSKQQPQYPLKTSVRSSSQTELEREELAKRVRSAAIEEKGSYQEIPVKLRDEYRREKNATIVTPTVKPASRRKPRVNTVGSLTESNKP